MALWTSDEQSEINAVKSVRGLLEEKFEKCAADTVLKRREIVTLARAHQSELDELKDQLEAVEEDLADVDAKLQRTREVSQARDLPVLRTNRDRLEDAVAEKRTEIEIKSASLSADLRKHEDELRTLTADRHLLLGRLHEIDQLLARWRGPRMPSVASQLDDAAEEDASWRDGPTTRQRIVKVLTEAGGPLRMATIVKRVQDAGSNSREDAIRTLIHRMHESNDLERPDRGLYELPDDRRTTTTAVTELKDRAANASGSVAQ